jgi:hypothetical protein
MLDVFWSNIDSCHRIVATQPVTKPSSEDQVHLRLRTSHGVAIRGICYEIDGWRGGLATETIRSLQPQAMNAADM